MIRVLKMDRTNEQKGSQVGERVARFRGRWPDGTADRPIFKFARYPFEKVECRPLSVPSPPPGRMQPVHTRRTTSYPSPPSTPRNRSSHYSKLERGKVRFKTLAASIFVLPTKGRERSTRRFISSFPSLG